MEVVRAVTTLNFKDLLPFSFPWRAVFIAGILLSGPWHRLQSHPGSSQLERTIDDAGLGLAHFTLCWLWHAAGRSGHILAILAHYGTDCRSIGWLSEQTAQTGRNLPHCLWLFSVPFIRKYLEVSHLKWLERVFWLRKIRFAVVWNSSIKMSFLVLLPWEFFLRPTPFFSCLLQIQDRSLTHLKTN